MSDTSVHQNDSMNPRLWTFNGSDNGVFEILSQSTYRGAPLPFARRLDVLNHLPGEASSPQFSLIGVVSNERYVTLEEKKDLLTTQQAIGRPQNRLGAVIPIKKSSAWWAFPKKSGAIFLNLNRSISPLE